MKIDGKIVKADDAHLCFGWASVAADEMGVTVVDSQGDVIAPAELEKAAYDFVMYSREGGENHEVIGVARLVESVVFTPEKCSAMGIIQQMPVGWWVGFKVDDETVWQKIKSGTYSMFSIGGRAKREAISDEQVD